MRKRDGPATSDKTSKLADLFFGSGAYIVGESAFAEKFSAKYNSILEHQSICDNYTSQLAYDSKVRTLETFLGGTTPPSQPAALNRAEEAVTGPGKGKSNDLVDALPALLVLLCLGAFNHFLAYKKGYSGAMLLWAWFPVVNFFGLTLFIGLPDKRLHDKIDNLFKEKNISS